MTHISNISAYRSARTVPSRSGTCRTASGGTSPVRPFYSDTEPSSFPLGSVSAGGVSPPASGAHDIRLAYARRCMEGKASDGLRDMAAEYLRQHSSDWKDQALAEMWQRTRQRELEAAWGKPALFRPAHVVVLTILALTLWLRIFGVI